MAGAFLYMRCSHQQCHRVSSRQQYRKGTTNDRKERARKEMPPLYLPYYNSPLQFPDQSRVSLRSGRLFCLSTESSAVSVIRCLCPELSWITLLWWCFLWVMIKVSCYRMCDTRPSIDGWEALYTDRYWKRQTA